MKLKLKSQKENHNEVNVNVPNWEIFTKIYEELKEINKHITTQSIILEIHNNKLKKHSKRINNLEKKLSSNV